MSGMTKVFATNVTGGPKILNSSPPVVLQPGQSTDGKVEIAAAELKSMSATGYFDIGDGSTPSADSDKPASLSGKTKAELLEIAAAEKVPEVSEEMTNADITSAIELHREAKS